MNKKWVYVGLCWGIKSYKWVLKTEDNKIFVLQINL